MTPKGEPLFPELNKTRYGENRRLRPLFLPVLLKDRARDKRLRGADQDRAYEIICKWADIESSGKLYEMKETVIEGEFCKEVFGDALGYTFFADHKDYWNFQPKFSVNGGIADAAIGTFRPSQKHSPRAVIELKGPRTNVDKDRSQGRTPVQQCWDYLNALPKCPWGVVCNYVSFRLYHREHTPRVYELFVLQELKTREVFDRFYYLFHRGGFIAESAMQPPRADVLLEKSITRERQVGEELYGRYHDERIKLITHLSSQEHKFSLDKAIHAAQKLLDRIIFIAFCEDRELLPRKSLKQAWETVSPYQRVTNPKWQNFINLFDSIDKGNVKSNIPPYDGGLFREDKDVDNLQLDDDWTDFFKTVGDYDFAHEINVDVLGHIFEKSINDIEVIRQSGIFEADIAEKDKPRMLKSAERKKGGIYYTPPEFTGFITQNTVTRTVEERIKLFERDFGIRLAEIDKDTEKKRVIAFAENAIEELRDIKVVDPACGSGAFLIRAFQAFEDKYLELIDTIEIHDKKAADELRDRVSDFILHDNLYGVDLSPEAVEITQLALWLRSAQKGKTLTDLSKNIVCGNSLISDPAVDKHHAFDWQKAFPDVFKRPNPGFDCVIGNPPWERIKLQEREFFDATAPEIASATNAAKRRKLIEKLKTTKPQLYQKYVDAKTAAENSLYYIRNCDRYPLTGKGDINTYAVFAELAHSIVSPTGRVGLLVPTGIATEHTTKDFFGTLVSTNALIALYDFENLAPIFVDVHRSYKFSVLLFGGSKNKPRTADFVFFARKIDELKDSSRHISLSAKDFKLLNPNTNTCPVFRSRRDANITKYIYKRVPVLINKTRKQGGNPWGIKFVRMFDQTNDAELFHTPEQLKSSGFKSSGSVWKKGKQIFLPLYEAKMFRSYDHRFGSVYIDTKNWINQGQTIESSLVDHQNPEFQALPRWWALKDKISEKVNAQSSPVLLAFRNITRATDTRTVIASFIPAVGVINSAPIILFMKKLSPRVQSCLLANLNSFILDFVAKRKIPNVNLNFFVIEQLPVLSPDTYLKTCPWDKKITLGKWISDRVLKLTCTSNDMIPLAKAAGFKPLVHKWDEAERLDLMAELDAAFFLLYEIKRNDVEYILSTFAGIRKESESMFEGTSTTERILNYYDKLKPSSR